MAARQINLDKLKAAILENPLGDKKTWLKAAGLGENFWLHNEKECDEVYIDTCRTKFKSLYQKALKAVDVVLSDPERKDYTDMSKFVLSHSEFITPERQEIINSNMTITIEED